MTHANASSAELWASTTASQIKRLAASLTKQEADALIYDWKFWGRPNQFAPEGDWTYWLALAGRGFGKTRLGAEFVRAEVEAGRAKRVALVAPIASDARDVMVEGESGLLNVCPPNNRPLHEPSKRRLTWPNGAMATTYSADEPERLRGPQHDLAWCDELAAWRYPAAWDMLQFGLRLPNIKPRCVITTTPKPVRLIRDLVADPTCVVTRGSTYENRTNLAPSFFGQIVRRYEGTRLGQQELLAELLEEAEGALWNRALIEKHRVKKAPDLKRIVVAIDPAVTSNEQSDETGIIVAGLGRDDRGYVLEDLSGRYTPDGWARKALGAYKRHKADRIIGEVNNGGDMIEHTIRTLPNGRNASYKAVRASRGKQARAEPVAALYEQGRVSHVGGLPDLEDQLCTWEPLGDRRSPDRLDAGVWALTELMLGGGAEPKITVL